MTVTVQFTLQSSGALRSERYNPAVRTVSRAWLAGAVALSGFLVLAAPFVGQLTAALRDVARGHYATVLAAAVAGAAAIALGGAALVIKDRRAFRYGCIAAAGAIAAGYGWAATSGVPDQDAAERFHFVEYGLLAVLFYKAWRPSDDASVLIGPVLGGFIVGSLEEWLQWVVPGRVGEMRDVLINLVASACGVLFALGLDPPSRVSFALRDSSRAPLTRLAAAAVVVFAVFFQAVHLGVEIVDPEAGVFRSHYTARELAAASHDRAEAWRLDPPTTMRRLSWEDQYLSEGVAHLRHRNRRADEGHAAAAWHENLILEKYFGPVLDTPSYQLDAVQRWSAQQRSKAEASRAGLVVYTSDALPYAVYAAPKWAFWSLVAAAVLVLFKAGTIAAARSR
jgi:hypothetical protein